MKGFSGSRGFTLIELLVVIAIIGILAAVVIGGVQQARIKGEGAGVKQAVSQLRTEAEIIYASTGSYDGMCAPGTQAETIFREAAKHSSLVTGITSMCLSSGTGNMMRVEDGVVTLCGAGCKAATPGQWAMSILMKDGQYFCVDYTGYAGTQAGRGIDNGPLDMRCQ